ncbi:hypothetical protein H9Q72_012674 [Fusarium xylarioides]|uniref:Peptidase C14 caspase domain-containing protein n=1 Tax=Fusarium xylarioides TaxID=221167 RepID=A0A9P7HGG4_9HYPO|nr:hypothetical protein H9Q70_008270 [Fusarium xylarioides]KAG5759198.1 hypothetical protein H9Q72_012674 [Fusarium xylarioides]KAG5777274.1 hypothetical protein H9Q73_009054 [Fusarium xylarioides]KAG5808065.1 hypothetical protein H9Q71_007376 [Fusarium xylarioides]KAG5821856.1 hypothetical protein H9Q74_007986 [Fusarium xylarioides]
MATSNLPDRWRPQHMSLDQFDTALKQACLSNAVFNFPQRPYKKARALCVHFERERQHLGVESTSDRIRDVFLKTYGYDAVSFMIKDGDPDPEASLGSALSELVADMDENCLAILHYIGHGKKMQNPSQNHNELHLSQSQSYSGHVSSAQAIQDPTIDFNRLRHAILDPSPSNVLILLDCCHAASGSIGQRKELIAACSFDSQCGGGADGFTNNVVQQLEHAYNQGQILSTSQLYNRLATKHFVMQGGRPELAAMPIFLQHHDDHVHSLFLMPTRLATHQSWFPAPTPGLRLQPANVILSVHLNNTDIQTLGAMQAWIGSRPYEIGHVRVDKVYRSSSIIVVFAITFSLWHSLPPSPAINFIGFECQDTPPYQQAFQALAKKENIPPTHDRQASVKEPGYKHPLSPKKNN